MGMVARCEEAFSTVKQLVASDKVMVYYDPANPSAELVMG